MTTWSSLPPEEIERRRAMSNAAMVEREHEEFARRYQEQCDRLYWTRGQCCAGCDHWISGGGFTGECSAAGIVSGMEVLRSMGVTFSSHIPAPGFPFAEAEFHCGKFSDDFDWSELEPEYLSRIGAMHDGQLRDKPSRRR